jgi:predicted AlkP superfamily phosphohydrolase/phosphomutase
MDTVLPEVSAAAWSSFMTGKNPAKTGIYGFFDMMPGSYSNVFTNFLHLKQPPIWNIIHKEIRKPSVTINMPSTFPAKPINGVLISGFVAPDIKKAVFPQSLLPMLEQMRYKIDLDVKKIQQNKEMLMSEAFETLDLRVRMLDILWGKLDWQLFSCVITGTDRLQHFIMDAFENPYHPCNKQFEEYYRRIDFFLGTVYDRLKPGDLLILLSDHGFEVTKYEVYLNVLFRMKGWFEDIGHEKKCFERITEATRVFNLDPARIYINRKPRYPNGHELSEEEYNNFLNEIKEELENLKSPEGEKVVKHIYTKEEIYNGKFVQYAPDLILVPHEGYSFKGATKPDNVFVRPVRHFGTHNVHDAFLACNYPMSPESKPNIMDLTPTMLKMLNIDISKYDFDGKPITINMS